jgi:hypothetical protein
MAIPNLPEPSVAVDDKGYLVLLNTDADRRWRERFKKLATVFYAWVLWTKLNSAWAQPGEGAGAVLGAGREMPAPADFDPTTAPSREPTQ